MSGIICGPRSVRMANSGNESSELHLRWELSSTYPGKTCSAVAFRSVEAKGGAGKKHFSVQNRTRKMRTFIVIINKTTETFYAM